MLCYVLSSSIGILCQNIHASRQEVGMALLLMCVDPKREFLCCQRTQCLASLQLNLTVRSQNTQKSTKKYYTITCNHLIQQLPNIRLLKEEIIFQYLSSFTLLSVDSFCLNIFYFEQVFAGTQYILRFDPKTHQILTSTIGPLVVGDP